MIHIPFMAYLFHMVFYLNFLGFLVFAPSISVAAGNKTAKTTKWIITNEYHNAHIIGGTATKPSRHLVWKRQERRSFLMCFHTLDRTPLTEKYNKLMILCPGRFILFSFFYTGFNLTKQIVSIAIFWHCHN